MSMSDILNITLFQFDPVWENSDSNILKLNKCLKSITEQTDLLILPEMFLTGFSMNAHEIAQNTDGEGVKWLSSFAKTKQITVAGSLPIKDNQLYYNRLLVATPDDKIQWYDKRHMFRMGKEHQTYTAGNNVLVFNIKGWNIMPLVCYDLRFPVWSRNVNQKYDILVYVSNWPEARREAFLTLLKARAIENQCYVIGINRVGTDGQGVSYAGDSVIIDFKGNYMFEPADNKEQIINCSISLNKLTEFRKKFPVWLDADAFEINS
jgi:predicted amidohydrolase